MEMDEQKKVEEFKKMLQEANILDSAHKDYDLIRFLSARKYDLESSFTMYSNAMKWRKETNLKDIVENFAYPELSKVKQKYLRYYHKTDKLGHTLYVEKFTGSFSELLEITTPERFQTHAVRELEKLMNYRLPACSAKKGTVLQKGTIIMDLEGAPLTQFNQIRGLVQNIANISSDYYPETLHKMIIINAPFLFSMVWSVIRAFLDEKTSSKIEIAGTNYKSILLEHVDSRNLPKYLGGSCICQRGCENSDIGPWNDGSVPGYPVQFWEDFNKRDCAHEQ